MQLSPGAKSLPGSTVNVVGPPRTFAAWSPLVAHEIVIAPAATSTGSVKVIETETSTAVHVIVPAELFSSPIYANVRKAYGRLAEIIGGLPPFTATLGKRKERAGTFEALRDRAIDLAKHGIQIVPECGHNDRCVFTTDAVLPLIFPK